jgi:hypothetical protein
MWHSEPRKLSEDDLYEDWDFSFEQLI